MKTVAAIGLLALSANAAVIKRQDLMAGGFSIPGFGDFSKIPGFDISNIAKSLPKGGLASLMNPSVRSALKIEEIKPLRNPQAKRIRLTYGPYKIRAANVSSSTQHLAYN
jgi:hypothetical protein